MPYLYLVRHAQPDFTGHYDSVTELGHVQSAWLGEHFAARGLRFARVISGSLARQSGTLDTILNRLPEVPARVVDARFNEYDAASVLATFHADSDRLLRSSGDRRGYFTAIREALFAWSRHEGPVPGGETWQQFGERISGAVATACEGLDASAPVLIVTSGGVIGRVIADTLGAGPEAAIQLNLQTRNTGITELACGRMVSRVVAFNAVPHLERPDRAHAVTHS